DTASCSPQSRAAGRTASSGASRGREPTSSSAPGRPGARSRSDSHGGAFTDAVVRLRSPAPACSCPRAPLAGAPPARRCPGLPPFLEEALRFLELLPPCVTDRLRPARLMKNWIMRTPEPGPLGLTDRRAIVRAIVAASLVKRSFGGRVETVFTLALHFRVRWAIVLASRRWRCHRMVLHRPCQC